MCVCGVYIRSAEYTTHEQKFLLSFLFSQKHNPVKYWKGAVFLQATFP